MKGARKCVILAAMIILAVSVSGMPPIPAMAQRQSAYAIYLSPGPRPGVDWGGYHVTVTSYSKNHAPGKSEKTEAAKAWKKVHGAGAFSFEHKMRGKDYWARDLGNGYGYGICFKSRELDVLTYELNNRKFDNQKQLDRANKGSKCRWHVSLYAKTPDEAYQKFEGLKHKPWRLYEVRYPGKDWTAI